MEKKIQPVLWAETVLPVRLYDTDIHASDVFDGTESGAVGTKS